MFENDRPPTSRDQARARKIRPPEGFHDPDQLSHWSVPMTVAWIIWGDLDAVREQWDRYRSECADWVFVRDPDAAREEDEIVQKQFATGKIIPTPPDLANRLKQGTWRLVWQPPANWNELSQQGPDVFPMDSINELWRLAGEGKLTATAFECRDANSAEGKFGELPPFIWPHLRRTMDKDGKATLSHGGTIFRDVQFARSDVKRIWPAWEAPPGPVEDDQKAFEEMATLEVNKGGRPAEYDWGAMREFVQALVSKHGKPGKGNKGLPSKAQLVEAVLDEWSNKGLHPSSSNVRRYINRWLVEL